MKTKLTLSISAEKVERIKAYSVLHQRSVSQLFEEFVEGVVEPDKATHQGRSRTYLVDLLDGILDCKITEEMLDNDPRLARIMGRR